MNGKSVYLLACCLLIGVFANSVLAGWSSSSSYSGGSRNSSLSHDLTVGARLPGDRLVFVEKVIKDSSWLRIVTLERTFNVSKYERITQVRALDQKPDGTGATASILNGGPGVSSVKLRFKSTRGHGIHFVVELYART